MAYESLQDVEVWEYVVLSNHGKLQNERETRLWELLKNSNF